METANGEAVRSSVSDEVNRPQNEPDNAGQGLLKRAFAKENLKRAWKRVKANKGAAGIDGLDIEQTAEYLLSQWPRILEQLLSGAYRPSPVKRVVIPKPDGGERELGRRYAGLMRCGYFDTTTAHIRGMWSLYQ